MTKTAYKSKSKAPVMEEFLKKQEKYFRVPRVGEVLVGEVIEITNNALYLDLGNFGAGIVLGRELFDDLDTFKKVKIGDKTNASVIDIENENGYVELSLKSASQERAWEELYRKQDSGEVFETEILDANRGGLIVRVCGITGFLPVSQLSIEHYPRVEGGDKNQILSKLKEFVGQKLKVVVLDVNRAEDKLIVSEKEALSESIKDTLSGLKIGDVVEGTISGVVDFGAFMKFIYKGQELEGLIHISELAWQRIDDPRDFVKVGQKVKAAVIGIDNTRVSLSIKKLVEDPWKKAVKNYKKGKIVTGEVIKTTPFGAFVKLSKDIHGLAHISELSLRPISSIEEVVGVGDKLKFKIISIDPEEHRLGLSLRELEKKKRVTKPIARPGPKVKKSPTIKANKKSKIKQKS